MKSIKDTLAAALVTAVFLAATSLHAEKGPAQDKTPDGAVKKGSFDDLLNDPSAILDMEEEELSGFLPALENKIVPLAKLPPPAAPKVNVPPPRVPTANPNSTSTLILASPTITPFTNPAYPAFPVTPPPPGLVGAGNDPTAAAGAGTNGAPLNVLQALPLCLAPSFFVLSKPGAPSDIKDLPSSTAMTPMAGVPDISVILAHNQFYPSRIKLKNGMQTRLIFTTTNRRPAALVIERLQIQRWIAKEEEHKPSSENERIRWEVSRELNASRVTEIVMDPKTGIYSFHDAMSGASGEITVEK